VRVLDHQGRDVVRGHAIGSGIASPAPCAVDDATFIGSSATNRASSPASRMPGRRRLGLVLQHGELVHAGSTCRRASPSPTTLASTATHSAPSRTRASRLDGLLQLVEAGGHRLGRSDHLDVVERIGVLTPRLVGRPQLVDSPRARPRARPPVPGGVSMSCAAYSIRRHGHVLRRPARTVTRPGPCRPGSRARRRCAGRGTLASGPPRPASTRPAARARRRLAPRTAQPSRNQPFHRYGSATGQQLVEDPACQSEPGRTGAQPGQASSARPAARTRSPRRSVTIPWRPETTRSGRC